MLTPMQGELAALATAVCWTVSALSFEDAGKKVGSLPVNWIRLVLGFLFLSGFSGISRGVLFPWDAGFHAWVWLSVSGLIGFVLGDLFLFQAFVLVGSRVAMLIMATVPPITAVMGWLLMGERLSRLDLGGMVLTMGGISLVILRRRRPGERSAQSWNPRGIVYAFLGALGQAGGLVLSKFGMASYNAFAATQIRVLTGIIGFTLVCSLHRDWSQIALALRHRRAMTTISLGSFFGPFLGVSLSLLAAQMTTTGVAATIMALVPLFIIPPSVVFFGDKVGLMDVGGALIAVTGVALLFAG